jgi:electron transfer flavoprotein beta subunit
LRVARETDAGIETVEVRLPAVVTADLRLNEPRYASLPSIMKAKNKPIERLDLSSLDVHIEPRVELVRLETSSTGRACCRVKTVDELIGKLRDEAKVL